MASHTLTTIFFDLDDTLHDDSGAFQGATFEIASRLATTHGVRAEELAKAFIRETESFWDNYDPARVIGNPRAITWARALDGVGVESAGLCEELASDFEAARKRRYRLFSGVAETLTKLRANGYRVAMLTNGLRATHQLKIQALQIASHFDEVFLSDDLGVAKPNVRIFEIACKRMGSRPAETVMVGDRYDKDIVGALDAGLIAIWLRVPNSAPPDGVRLPHAIIGHITQVPDIVTHLSHS